MKAYKCDRCGLLYEKGDSYPKYLITIAIIKNGYLDLCAGCQNELDSWMNEEREYDDNSETK